MPNINNMVFSQWATSASGGDVPLISTDTEDGTICSYYDHNGDLRYISTTPSCAAPVKNNVTQQNKKEILEIVTLVINEEVERMVKKRLEKFQKDLEDYEECINDLHKKLSEAEAKNNKLNDALEYYHREFIRRIQRFELMDFNR